MVFVKGQKPKKGRTKPRIGRKIKGMNKNAKQTAYYAANSWTTFAKSCLIITLLTVNQKKRCAGKPARKEKRGTKDAPRKAASAAKAWKAAVTSAFERCSIV